MDYAFFLKLDSSKIYVIGCLLTDSRPDKIMIIIIRIIMKPIANSQ